MKNLLAVRLCSNLVKTRQDGVWARSSVTDGRHSMVGVPPGTSECAQGLTGKNQRTFWERQGDAFVDVHRCSAKCGTLVEAREEVDVRQKVIYDKKANRLRRPLR